MPFTMKLWQVQGNDLQEISHEALNDEQRLEDWVVKDPSILGIDVMLIGRQVTTAIACAEWSNVRRSEHFL
jgi:hypothetical protein